MEEDLISTHARRAQLWSVQKMRFYAHNDLTTLDISVTRSSTRRLINHKNANENTEVLGDMTLRAGSESTAGWQTR